LDLKASKDFFRSYICQARTCGYFDCRKEGSYKKCKCNLKVYVDEVEDYLNAVGISSKEM